jgi:glycosyltransferase involved in cell wall biosynthesis
VRILFLTARFPWPLLRGDQLRAYHQLRALPPCHRLTLVSFCDAPVPPAGLAAVSALCERVVTVPLERPAMATGLAQGAFSSLPFQVSMFRHPRMRDAVREVLAGQAFDLAHAQLARMAPHVEDLPLARFVDLVDALSLGTRRRSLQHRGPLRWLTSLEAARLLRYERRICASMEGASVVSSVDRDAIGGTARPAVVPNGVDVGPLPLDGGGRESATVVLTGNMGYVSNANAACWYAEHVHPLVRRSVPEARFLVIGTRPAARVRRLNRADRSVSVLGFVDDLRRHLGAATVAVAPMQAGSGLQNKVLEAMASGTPVVATPVAAEALRGVERRRPGRRRHPRDFCGGGRRAAAGPGPGPKARRQRPALRREPLHLGTLRGVARGAARGGPLPALIATL